jgi:Subtilase family
MIDRVTYRHLHMRRLGVASTEFRAIGGGTEKGIPPIENRDAHAAKLAVGLNRAVAQMDAYRAAQKDAGVPANKRGSPITVEGRPNVQLRVGQARSGGGFALLNVRRHSSVNPESGEDTDQATFFVTPGTLETFRRNLESYGAWSDPFSGNTINIFDEDDDDGSGRPRRFKLFESAAQIRATTLLDLWTDRLDRYPRQKGDYEWEIWTRADFQDSFDRVLGVLGLRSYGHPSVFVDTVVRSVIATPAQVAQVVQASAAVVGLRSASTFVSSDLGVGPRDPAATIHAVTGRVRWPHSGSPVVSLLDTGVQSRHPLLAGASPAKRRFTAEPFWGVEDHHGHGTQMAGIVLYGDLATVPKDRSPVDVVPRLESVVVTAPANAPPVPARDAIKRAVEAVEDEPATRVFCLAQTAAGEATDGLPTSTSSVLDLLAYGDGNATRLFCVAVGNVPHSDAEPYQVGYYADRNTQFGIQAPAQALNALSVGAVTLKTARTPGQKTVAGVGDLSPTSRTAQSWSKLHAHKPDIVMEGGNFLVDEDRVFCRPSPAHLVLTTARSKLPATLSLVGETSAATAACAGLASRLLARYPRFRMETVRALMVHVAEWTPVMKAQFEVAVAAGVSKPEAFGILISRFGWGKPDEARLFESASHALTLIAEDTLRPYRSDSGSSLPLREMKYFKLPWPKASLRALGATNIEMRCTLSYFVEPDPHAADRDRIERYPSHRLRFDVKRFGESDAQAQARVNELAPAANPAASTSDDGWVLGVVNRHRGTLHHDVWRGPAHQLVERDGISVHPVRGWWGDTRSFERYDREVNFSLVVSIRTPEAGAGDLFAEAAAAVNTSLLVEARAALVQT